MATKKTEKTTSKKENASAREIKEPFRRKFMRILRDERTRFVIGLIVLFFSIFMVISFISFFFDGAADQSIIDYQSSKEMNSIGNGIQNWGGSHGAAFADFFINRWIGVSAFFIPIFLARLGLKLMNVFSMSIVRSLAYTCALIIICSLTFGFFFKHFYEDSYLFLGGYHGYYATEWLEAQIGWPGTLLVILSGILLLLIAVSRRTIVILRHLFRMDFLPKKKPADTTMPASEPAGATGSNVEIPNDETSTATDTEIPAINDNPTAEPGNLDEMPVDEPHDENEPSYDVHAESTDDFMPEQEMRVEDEVYKVMSTDETSPVVTEPTFTIDQGVVEDEAKEQTELDEYDPTLDLSYYKAPTFDLLREDKSSTNTIDINEQEANKQRIINTLENYGIRISSIKATVGPTVTLYEIVPEAGIKISKIKNLEDDIALSLAALGIRIIAPIPGKGTVGIEVPNRNPQMVPMRPIIASRKFQECDYELPLALGKTITNEIFMVDLCKMPHILVAGATGQGKSVGLNAIITSLLYKKHPSQLKFVMVDPKKVEFSIYSVIERHFLAKLPDSEEAIITDTDKVVQTLSSVCVEMDNRYKLLQMARMRNIKEYNAKFISRQLNPENGHRYMPYIVVIIDEFGDLIMTAGKEVELPIARIAQLARAVGIHMIIATQRPSTNIITGSIKANFPARIAFKVASMIDSRTILDTPGANQLIGKGDMLVSCNGGLTRVQCAFVDTPEVENICQYIGSQQAYPTAYLLPEYVSDNNGANSNAVDLKDRDPFFEEAARLIVANQQGSTSLIQRKFSIGYNRAGRLMDQLEAAGIVGPFEGSKARQVLVADEIQLSQILNTLR